MRILAVAFLITTTSIMLPAGPADPPVNTPPKPPQNSASSFAVPQRSTAVTDDTERRASKNTAQTSGRKGGRAFRRSKAVPQKRREAHSRTTRPALHRKTSRKS